MYSYQLTEFNSHRKDITLISAKSNLQEVLAEFYKERLEHMFDTEGASKGYISVFVNERQLPSIKDIQLTSEDAICIVTSIAGG